MDCPKCGYEHAPEAVKCQMCGLDFILWERQQAEKKILAERYKQNSTDMGELQMEGGLDTGEGGIPSGKKAVSEKKIVGKCPKCSYPRREQDLDCPNCGVIYEKHEQLLSKQQEEFEAQKKEEKRRFAEERARIQQQAEKGMAKERARREKEALRKTAEMKALTNRALRKEKRAEQIKHAAERTKLVAEKIKKLKMPKGLTAKLLTGLVVIALVWGAVAWMLHLQDNARQRRLQAKQEKALRKISEEQQRIATRFRENKIEIVNYLCALIDGRKFAFFEEEIQRYTIPPLQGELNGVNQYLEEIKLFDTTKGFPEDANQPNFDAFLKLSQMSPQNRFYAEKLALYRKKYAEENFRCVNEFLKKKNPFRTEFQTAMACMTKAVELEGNKEPYDKAMVELKKAELLFFDGNEKVQMAVRNDGVTPGATGGQRKLFVWIKNVGQDSFIVNVDFFTMVGKDDKEYKFNNFSKELVTEVKPGDQAQGNILFYTRVEPKELIFAHVNAGTISRRFP